MSEIGPKTGRNKSGAKENRAEKGRSKFSTSTQASTGQHGGPGREEGPAPPVHRGVRDGKTEGKFHSIAVGQGRQPEEVHSLYKSCPPRNRGRRMRAADVPPTTSA